MHRVTHFSILSIAVGVVLGVVVLLVACGGGSPSTTEAAATTTASSSTTTTESPVSTASTEAPSSTEPSAAIGSGAGSKAEPVALGSEATVGTWKVTVTKVDLDADSAVKDTPGYQAAEQGAQYVLVDLKATYDADIPDSFSNGVGCQIVGSNGDTFNAVELGLEDSITNSDAVTKGGSVSGSLVFMVPADQIDGATLWVAPSSAEAESGVYFSLK